jgi:hypothetical protein
VELPKITHSSQIPELLRQLNHGKDKHKSNSVISVKKYLRVKSQNQDTLVEEEEDRGESSEEIEKPAQNTVKRSSHRTKNAVKDSTGKKSQEAYRDGKQMVDGSRRADDKVEYQQSASDSHPEEQSFILTQGTKEKLITNTAHALGVVSYDWAKKISKLMQNSEGEKPQASGAKSRAETRAGYRHQISTPAQANRGNFKTKAESTQHRPTTSVHREQAGDAEKIEKLKSIYDAGSQPRNRMNTKHISRQPSRCNSRHPSRPPTRMHEHRSGTRTHQSRPASRMGHGGEFQSRPVTGMGRGSNFQSRPVTRMGHGREQRPVDKMGRRRDFNSRPVTRMGSEGGKVSRPATRESSNQRGNLESLDESTYWNELSQKNIAAAGHARAETTPTHNTDANNNNGATSQSERKPADLKKFTMTTGWNEDMSRMVAKKRREMGGKEASTDKIAQAIALAMKFRKPRESLMRKLTRNREAGGGEGSHDVIHHHTRKGVALQERSPQEIFITKQLTKAST